MRALCLSVPDRDSQREKFVRTLPGQGRNTAASCHGHLMFKVRLSLELGMCAESCLSLRRCAMGRGEGAAAGAGTTAVPRPLATSRISDCPLAHRDQGGDGLVPTSGSRRARPMLRDPQWLHAPWRPPLAQTAL